MCWHIVVGAVCRVLCLSPLERWLPFLCKCLQGFESILGVQDDVVCFVFCDFSPLPAIDRSHSLGQSNGTAFANVVGQLDAGIKYFLSGFPLFPLFVRENFH